MKDTIYLIAGPAGIRSMRKSTSNMRYDEIAMKINIEVPNEWFKRPAIQANLKVEVLPDNEIDTNIILRTKDLIEQQTGAKIAFSVTPIEKEKNTETPISGNEWRPE